MLRHSLAVVLALGLAACQPKPDNQLDDYLERLERVLQQSRPEPSITLPDRPSRNSLLPAKNEVRVSLLSPLSLKPCGVVTLIAEHNSSLGKVATPMTQWLYHKRLVNGLNQCDETKLSAEGQALRAELLAQRQPQLPLLFSRLLLLSDAVWFNLGDNRAGWQWQGEQQASDSLEVLQQFRQPNHETIEAELFEQLQQWELSEFPATLHRSMVSTTVHLNQASALLRQAGPDACRADKLEPLKGILRAIYGKRIQGHLVQVQRMDNRLTPLVRDLLTPLPAHPYFDFYLGDDASSLRPRFYQAIDDHTQAWQALLRRCQGNADISVAIER